MRIQIQMAGNLFPALTKIVRSLLRVKNLIKTPLLLISHS